MSTLSLQGKCENSTVQEIKSGFAVRSGEKKMKKEDFIEHYGKEVYLRQPMTSITYIGCDPGITGGWAAISPKGTIKTRAMPTMNIRLESGKKRKVLSAIGILNILYRLPLNSFCCIEKQISVRFQNVNACETTFMNYGMLIMALEAVNIDYREIAVEDWHANFGIIAQKKGVAGKTTKEQALEIVRAIRPNLNLKGTLKAKKAHEGIVDAVLLAEYCKHMVRILEKKDGRKANIRNT